MQEEVERLPPYRLARLSDQQMGKIEALENEIGLTLIAYEPTGDAVDDTATQQFRAGEEQHDLIDEALLDTYRTHDPLI